MHKPATSFLTVLAAMTILAATAFAQSPRSGGSSMGGPSTGPSSTMEDSHPGMGSTADDDNGLPASDRTFVLAAARGGLEEVQLGKLAAGKAVDPDVKSFGQRMVDDHSKANDKLRQAVSDKGVSLPSDLDRKARAEVDRLAKLEGSAFDRAYVRMMVKDHVKDVADFNRESSTAHDPQVRQFVTDTLPTLQDHLKMAKDLESKVGLTPAGRGSHR